MFCIFCAMVVGALVSPNAGAADGDITFTGGISNVSCLVSPGAGANGSQENLLVSLPTVSSTALPYAGMIAGKRQFILTLSGLHCTDGAGVSIWFEAPPETLDVSTGALVNKGTAPNVQVSLLNKNGRRINLTSNRGGDISREVISGGQATLTYYAQLESTGAVTEGSVDTWLYYSLAYD